MTSQRPQLSTMVLEVNIPQALKEIPQWCVWKPRWDQNKGKWGKIPVLWSDTSKNASVTDASTCTSFEIATDIVREEHWGVGFIVTEGDPFTGIDLDHCRDSKSGVIETWATQIIHRLDSYTETSPSGSGIRIFVKGVKPGARCRVGNVEIYDKSRMFTVTGNSLSISTIVEERQPQLEEIYNQFLASVVAAPSTDNLANIRRGDIEVIEMAKSAKNGSKFKTLWSGHWSELGYPSQSEADQALVSMLLHWSAGNLDQADRLFRLSGLNRDKWEHRRDYRERTLLAASNNSSNLQGLDANKGSDAEMEETDPQLTDLGNSQRLVRQHGHDLRYCQRFHKWFVWDGKRWSKDDTGEVYRRAKQTVSQMYTDASSLEETGRKALVKHALKTESERSIKAMVELAKTEPGIHAKPEDFDQGIWLLNVQNGTLDLRTGALRPHNRQDLITRLVEIPYQPEATCPIWESFLETVMAGDEQLISFIQRSVGYTLTGDTSERCLFVCHGGGANGKTTVLRTMAFLLADYGCRTPTETLMAKRTGSIPNDVARLNGARYVFASEAEEGQKLAEATIKDITGADIISARFMRGEWFDFTPVFKIWLATNHKPKIRGRDNAIWDRIRLIPFEVSIPTSEQDPRLLDKLQAESAGILAWAVRGCQDRLQDGLQPPRKVIQATAAYRAEMDDLGLFLDEHCILKDGVVTSAKALFDAYSQWTAGDKTTQMSQKAFGGLLTEKGFERDNKGGNGRKQYIGIGLIRYSE